MRLVVSTNLLPPYRVKMFEQLIRQASVRGIAVELVVWAADMLGRGWDRHLRELPVHLADTRPLQSGRPLRRIGEVLAPSRLARTTAILRRLRPDLILSSGYGLPTLAASLSTRPRPRVLLWSEAIPGVGLDERRLRRAQRRSVSRLVDAFVVPGSAAAKYARSVAAAKPILRFPNCVDVDLFHPGPPAAGGGDALSIVSVGRLDPDKAIPALLDPMLWLHREGLLRRWTVVGNGPLAGDLATIATRLLGERFEWHPRLNPPELAQQLRAADLFALTPTCERWGFAVQEAVSCGLPVVISDRVGNIPDLVRVDKTGFVVPEPGAAGFEQKVVDALLAAGGGEARAAAREHALRLQPTWSPQASAVQLLDGIEALMADG
jgi:glycosyltransferase involved in cell wall biosynthesis